MFGSPNTSEPFDESSDWLITEEALIASLHRQPLLIVVRPDSSDLSEGSGFSVLFRQIQSLHQAGLRHLEVAWVDHPAWCGFVRNVQRSCPDLQVGAASLTQFKALEDAHASGLTFGMAPCFEPALLMRARRLGILLVPGVFSPTEMFQAMGYGCRLIKLFPAAQLGVDYLRSLKGPLGPLPEVIAAGGLGVDDLEPWLEAGHTAIALGRRVIGSEGIDPTLLRWLVDVCPKCYR